MWYENPSDIEILTQIEKRRNKNSSSSKNADNRKMGLVNAGINAVIPFDEFRSRFGYGKAIQIGL